MKILIVGKRVILDVTRYEALLIKDAVYDFQQNRSETLDWDSQNDPVVVSQLVKGMEIVD